MATRHEKVVLSLQDDFTTGMARAAASAALLNRELDSLSKDSIRTRRGLSDIDRPMQNMSRSAGGAGREIDKLSGRMRILGDVAAILGPSLVPIGALGIPAIAGLASQFGFAAIAAGSTVIAFQGVGDAISTMNKAALDPTSENLDKARIALERLSPAAQGFVAEIGHLVPEMHKLRDVAASGLFPGLTDGLVQMEAALPRVQRLISSVSTEMGSIASDIGGSLASDRWAPFLDFIADEAPQALGDMAKAAGNTAHAVAELWMATDPLNDDFSQWLVDATADLDRWAGHLSETQGFADFLAYVETTGPEVADAFGAIANAVVQILQAAAPLGGPVLEGITALANVVSAIADSDLGTPLFTAVAALALFNRTLAITGAVQKATFGGPALGAIKSTRVGVQSLTADLRSYNAVQNTAAGRARASAKQIDAHAAAAGRLGTRLGAVSKGAGALAGLAIASSGAADKIGLTNTASLALMGTFISPGWGTALGGAAGAVIDLTHANDGLEDSIVKLNAATKSADFGAITSGIKDVKKQVDDIQHTTGIGDFFGDQASKVGDALKHPFDFHAGDERIGRGKDAIGDAKSARTAALAQNQLKLLAAGFEATAAGAKNAADSTADFQETLQKLNDALNGRASFRDYQAAIDDFSDSIKENGKTLDVSTEKGRANQAALDAIAGSALTVAKTLSGSERATFLDAARDSYIKAAQAAGMTKAAAKAVADEVLGLDNVVGHPKIVIDANGAYHVIDNVERRLRQFKDKTVRLTVLQVIAQTNKNRADFADIHGADGTTVPGQRYPYGDKVLAYVAPGEEVISNRHGQADRYRDVLKAINANRYADGGTMRAIGGPVSSSSVSIDYERLATAMSAVRPIYGDAHFHGDAVKREQDRLSSLDGISR